MQDIERFTKQNIEKVFVAGFEAEPGEKAEPLAMGRQTIWGGLGKPPSRDVMQAAAKAARSEMMTRIRDTKGAQPARSGGGGEPRSPNAGRGRSPAGAGAGAGGSRSGGGFAGGYAGNGGGSSDRRAPAQPRGNSGYSQGGQPSGQPRNAHAPAPRQRDSESHNDFDNHQPASHASSGFPSSGQPTGNRNNFRGGNRSGGGGGGAGGLGGRSTGPRRSGGPGSFTGR